MKRDLKNLKISQSDIKRRVRSALNTDLREREMYMKYRIFKGTAVAATLTLALATSVFAMTPTGQEAIGNMISYFNSSKADEITSYEALAQYNKEIGSSDTKNGVTLTLDNVAADDNFVHVFYTVKSEKPLAENMNSISPAAVWADAAVNGRVIGYDTNHSDYEGYYEDEYTAKMVQKFNVSTLNIPDKFKLELMAQSTGKPDNGAGLSSLYNYAEGKAPTVNLTDEEKSKILYVSADIDISEIKVNTVSKDTNIPLWNEKSAVEKIILSPFGNQLVIRSEIEENEEAEGGVTSFALFDENDKCLDILNTDTIGTYNGVARNSFEFLKADANTKQIKFVPIAFEPVHADLPTINKKIGAYPITFETSDYGKIVVTDIRITDGIIEIDYYKDGYFMYDPEFDILDANGNSVYPEHKGGEMRCLYDVKVNHKDNSYTAKYQYYYYDENDNDILAKEEANAEVLRERFMSIALRSENYIKLDFKNAITVDLK